MSNGESDALFIRTQKLTKGRDPDYVIHQVGVCVQPYFLSLLSIHTNVVQRQRDGCTVTKPRLHHLAHKAQAHRRTLGRAWYAFGHTTCHPCQPDSLTLHSVVESRFRRKKTRAGLDVFQFAQTLDHDAWEDNEFRQNLRVGRRIRVLSCAGLVVMPLHS